MADHLQQLRQLVLPPSSSDERVAMNQPSILAAGVSVIQSLNDQVRQLRGDVGMLSRNAYDIRSFTPALDALNIAMKRFTVDSTIIDVNPSYERLCGHKAERLLGAKTGEYPILGFMHSISPHKIDSFIQACHKQRQSKSMSLSLSLSMPEHADRRNSSTFINSAAAPAFPSMEIQRQQSESQSQASSSSSGSSDAEVEARWMQQWGEAEAAAAAAATVDLYAASSHVGERLIRLNFLIQEAMAKERQPQFQLLATFTRGADRTAVEALLHVSVIYDLHGKPDHIVTMIPAQHTREIILRQ